MTPFCASRSSRFAFAPIFWGSIYHYCNVTSYPFGTIASVLVPLAAIHLHHVWLIMLSPSFSRFLFLIVTSGSHVNPWHKRSVFTRMKALLDCRVWPQQACVSIREMARSCEEEWRIHFSFLQLSFLCRRAQQHVPFFSKIWLNCWFLSLLTNKFCIWKQLQPFVSSICH